MLVEYTVYCACRGKMRCIVDEFEDFKDEIDGKIHDANFGIMSE